MRHPFICRLGDRWNGRVGVRDKVRRQDRHQDKRQDKRQHKRQANCRQRGPVAGGGECSVLLPGSDLASYRSALCQADRTGRGVRCPDKPGQRHSARNQTRESGAAQNRPRRCRHGVRRCVHDWHGISRARKRARKHARQCERRRRSARAVALARERTQAASALAPLSRKLCDSGSPRPEVELTGSAQGQVSRLSAEARRAKAEGVTRRVKLFVIR